MRLFSSFDVKLFLFPFISFLFIVIFINNFIFSSFFSFIKFIFNFFYFFFYRLKPLFWTEKLINYFVGLFFSLFFMNYFSIFPYVFSITTRAGMIMFLRFFIVSCCYLFSFYYNFYSQLSHFIPLGTPFFLVWFLFLVELVSRLIRPITLSVRLLANVLAGHLLITLLSNFLLFVKFRVFPAFILLLLFEFCVSLIQSYIFVTLLSLYFSEV